MKLRDITVLRILRTTILLLLLLISTNSYAVITLKIIDNNDLGDATFNPFTGNVTGPIFGPVAPNFFVNSIDDFMNANNGADPMAPDFGPANIFWEGIDDTPPFFGTTFVNTLGTSSISWGFQNDSFFFQAFNTGTNTYNNPLVFGDNIANSATRSGNITDFGAYATTNLVGGGISVFNPDNTATTRDWISTDGGTVTTTLETIAGFWVTHEQVLTDPTLETIFTENLFSDPSLSRLISREGLIAHFLFIISNIQPNSAGDEWTLLYYDFSQSESMDSGMGDDFNQINFGATLVSYDDGAIPTPIPAAVWLFGTGLLGMVAFARRKSDTTKL